MRGIIGTSCKNPLIYYKDVMGVIYKTLNSISKKRYHVLFKNVLPLNAWIFNILDKSILEKQRSSNQDVSMDCDKPTPVQSDRQAS